MQKGKGGLREIIEENNIFGTILDEFNRLYSRGDSRSPFVLMPQSK